MKKPSAPPVVEIAKAEPLFDYYHDSDGNEYAVTRVIEYAKDLPVFEMPLAGICLDWQIWKGCDMVGLAFHCKKVMDADLNFPVIFDCVGNIADGRHRVLKALIEGRSTIKAKRLNFRMTPCRSADASQ